MNNYANNTDKKFINSCRNTKLNSPSDFYNILIFLQVYRGHLHLFQEFNLVGEFVADAGREILEKLRHRNNGLNFYRLLVMVIFHHWSFQRVWQRVQCEESNRLKIINEIENGLGPDKFDVKNRGIKEEYFRKGNKISYAEYLEIKDNNFQKDFIDDNGYIPAPFLDELIKLVKKFNMTWLELHYFLDMNFQSHKWHPGFTILKNLNEQYAEILEKSTLPFKRFKTPDSDIVKGNNQQNSLAPRLTERMEINFDEILGKWDKVPLKPNFKETYFQRIRHINSEILTKNQQILAYIEQATSLLSQPTETTFVSAVTLWFNCDELDKQKHIIKRLINIFFKNLKQEYKHQKIFYIRQIFYDKLMGLQLDMVLISDFDLNSTINETASNVNTAHDIASNSNSNSNSNSQNKINSNLVADLWRKFCVTVPYTNKTVVTQSQRFELDISKRYVLSCDLLQIFKPSIKDYCILTFSRAGFVDVDLPMIKSFSKGKIHAK